MTKLLRTAATAIALTTFSAGYGAAATVTADYSHGDGRYIDIRASSGGSLNNVFAGNFVLDPITGDNIVTFCVDLANKVANNVTYQVKTLADSGFSATVQSNINRLFSTFYGTLGGGRTETAAFQTALWEIVDEKPTNPLRMNEGRFRIGSSAVRDRAQQMLDGLGDATDEWKLTFLDADGAQDQLGAMRNPVGAQVPLPAGLPLMLSALGGFALLRRSRKSA